MTDPAERFARDAAQWKQDSECMSSITDMVLLDSYQRIIGLGPAAVPLIIEDLTAGLADAAGPDHWFWALAAIVGEDHGHGATTVTEAAQNWVAWYTDQLAHVRHVKDALARSMMTPSDVRAAEEYKGNE